MSEASSSCSGIIVIWLCCVALQGGRNARNPILSEDVLMMRMKGKSMRKKDAQAMALDPFAPEYGTETWHQAQQARIAMQVGGGNMCVWHWCRQLYMIPNASVLVPSHPVHHVVFKLHVCVYIYHAHAVVASICLGAFKANP